MKKLLVSILALLAGAVYARSFDVRLWRGETTYARLPDYAELGEAPKGISLRVGALQSVAHHAPNDEANVRLSLDRVDFAAKGSARYVKVSSAPDAAAGVHQIGNLRLTVVDRVLPEPKDWKYHLDLWQHPWAVARVAGVEPFSDRHYEAMRPLWTMLARAGQKVLTTTLLDEPWDHQCRDAYHPMVRRVRAKDGSWRFDYSLFDRYVAFGRQCGIGPQIACYTMCPWGYLVSWEDESGRIEKREARPGTPFFEEYWGPFLVDFARHLKEKGLFADTYMAMDERSPEDVRLICSFIQEKAPGLKVSLAGDRRPSDFKGIALDNYSQALDRGASESESFRQEVLARRAEGKITTCYVCCIPSKPNTFIGSGLDEAYYLGAYPSVGTFDGFLRWAYNSWPEDAMKDASFGTWMAGDTFLVYPDGSPSVRFLELRNGLVAAEKLRLLREERAVSEGEENELRKLFDVKAALRGENFKSARECLEKIVNRVR